MKSIDKRKKPFVKSANNPIQCRDCEGYDHIQAECANTLKKKSKAMNTTWSMLNKKEVKRMMKSM